MDGTKSAIEGVLEPEASVQVANDASVPATGTSHGIDTESSTQGEPEQKLSKKAQKRAAKLARWEAGREDRIKRKKEQKIAKRDSLRAAIAAGEVDRPVRRSIARQVNSTLRILIDCSFDDLMTDREIKSMCSQLTRCHAENRVARRPCTVYMTSWNNKIAERFDRVFQNQQRKWNNVRVFEEAYMTSQDGTDVLVDGINMDDLIYLSADAEETAHEIDESKVYIIGGIVDKNRYKNLCLDKARQQGIKTAKLPIGEYISMASRKILTVNHVFEIMSNWLETRNWEQAFLKVIPKRKLPTIATTSNASEAQIEPQDQDGENEEAESAEEAEEPTAER